MSYILDALRRLEQDKTRARKGVDPLRSFGEPARPVQGRTEKRRILWLSAGFLLLLVTALVVAYWLVHHSDSAPETRRVSEKPEAITTSGTGPRATGVFSPPGTPSPLPRNESAVESPDLSAVRSSSLYNGRGSSRPLSSRTSLTKSPLPDQERGTPPDSSHEDEKAYSSVHREKIPDSTTQARSSVSQSSVQRSTSGHKQSGLKVSAIVWSHDRDKRFAVVNLKTVYEGDLIGDLAVVEILEDGIVFEEEGETFEVMLGKR